MTRIALIRHFPTDWNAEGRLQGRTDRPLTDVARAELAGYALPPPWDGAAVLASTLSRARDTAVALAEGRPVQTDARLVEQSWGVWEGRRSEDLLADAASGFVPTFRMDPEIPAPGGESQQDVLARVRPLLSEIAASGQDRVIVCHKAVMRALLWQAHLAAGSDPPEVKRRRLYPVAVCPDGTLHLPEAPVRFLVRGN